MVRRSWHHVQLYTVGHSTRSLDELVELLRAFGISLLVDIRTVPRSRRNPQFNIDALPSALRALDLDYVHLPRLGGLRRVRRDSVNTAWRNASFQGYADHMQTEEFEEGLAELLGHLVDPARRPGPGALMCAEAVPWRCHRSLVADALTVRGAEVQHVMSTKRAQPHRMTPFAQVAGDRVTYPGQDDAAPDPAPSTGGHRG